MLGMGGGVLNCRFLDSSTCEVTLYILFARGGGVGDGEWPFTGGEITFRVSEITEYSSSSALAGTSDLEFTPFGTAAFRPLQLGSGGLVGVSRRGLKSISGVLGLLERFGGSS